MTTVAAAQHFFSSVPAEQSPVKRRGYQTLFRTRGLSEGTIRAIEDRAQYTTAPGDPVKRQFYPLPDDLAAISQSAALAELDEFGRKGRYLTHTLILRLQDFRQLGACPLDVFTQFQFATTLAEVFRQGQPGLADAPPVQLNITPDWQRLAYQASQQWLPDELAKLGRLAWQAERLSEKRESVALLGPDADQFSSLGLLFLLASPVQRTRLSFDTHAAGCEWGRGLTFWAQGYADQAETRTTHIVNCRSRMVTSTLSPVDDGPYAAWMLRDVLPTRLRLDGMWSKQEWAARLEAVLTGQAQVPVDGISHEFVRQFAQFNDSAVAKGWAAQLPAGLSAELIQKLTVHISNDPATYFEIMVEGIRPLETHEFMFQGLLALGDAPAKGDRQILEKWIKASGHPGLLTLVPLWDKDGKAWYKSLMVLTPQIYEVVVSELVRWPQPLIPLWEALVGPHASAWMRLAGPIIPPGDWKKALPILEKMGDSLLEELAGLVSQLRGPARAEIMKWLKGYNGKVLALRSALGVRARAEKGLFRR